MKTGKLDVALAVMMAALLTAGQMHAGEISIVDSERSQSSSADTTASIDSCAVPITSAQADSVDAGGVALEKGAVTGTNKRKKNTLLIIGGAAAAVVTVVAVLLSNGSKSDSPGSGTTDSQRPPSDPF